MYEPCCTRKAIAAVASPDPDASPSAMVQCCNVYHSTIPDFQIRICHWIPAQLSYEVFVIYTYTMVLVIFWCVLGSILSVKCIACDWLEYLVVPFWIEGLVIICNYSFHWHVQNATIPYCSQELLPFLSVMYFFLPPFSTNYSFILSHLILPSISWSASQSCCSKIRI